MNNAATGARAGLLAQGLWRSERDAPAATLRRSNLNFRVLAGYTPMTR
jgi:hypothetical protein